MSTFLIFLICLPVLSVVSLFIAGLCRSEFAKSFWKLLFGLFSTIFNISFVTMIIFFIVRFFIGVTA